MSIERALSIPKSTEMFISTVVTRRSAIVGPEATNDAERIPVDDEGAIHGQSTMKTYADRARHAAGRSLSQYVTGARLIVARGDLHPVGWLDPIRGITLGDGMKEVVAAWLEVAVIDPAEWSFSG